MREDVKILEKSIAARLKLKDIQYDCGWNVEHYRGCLKSLERLANMHEKDMKQLEGRKIILVLIFSRIYFFRQNIGICTMLWCKFGRSCYAIYWRCST